MDIANEQERELVLFQAGDMLCGLDTLHVQEINHNVAITPVHRAPVYVRGVINLRGEIITVLDLHCKLGLGPNEINDDTQVVVVRNEGEYIALLVDSIYDVVNTTPAEISPPPSNVDGVTGAFFNGVYRMKNELVAVLDLDELLKK